MKEFIIKQFKMLGDKIRDEEKLKEYINFCYDNALTEALPRTTAKHHILPAAKLLPFKEFKNLTENPWNGVILTNYNHYYAHYLLVLAIKHVSISHAFCAMHNKDINLNRLTEADLISETEYTKIYAERNELKSKRALEIINVNGVEITRSRYQNLNRKISPETIFKMSERMKGKNNIVYKPGVVHKIRKTKLERGMDKVSAQRAALTMKQEFLDQRGNTTTIYKETAKKYSTYLLTEYIDNKGNITTKAKERGKIRSNNDIYRGRWYIVKNILDVTISIILPEVLIRKISPALMFKTQQDYLGKSKYGANKFNKENKQHLIGLYCEKLQAIPENYNLDQDYSPYL